MSSAPASQRLPPGGETLSIHGPALSGWQTHQSHGSITVVFYVALATNSDDLEVEIDTNYIVAGVRGFEPVVKARLYARVNPASSSWQLERHPKQSRSRGSRIREHSGSGNESGSSGRGGQASSSSGRRHSGQAATSGSSTSRSKRGREQSRQTTASQGSSNEGSGGSSDGALVSRPPSLTGSVESYEVLQQSVEGVERSSSDPFSTDTVQAPPQQRQLLSAEETVLTSPHSPLSNTSGQGSPEGTHGVSSLHSSAHLGSATSYSQQSSEGTGEGEELAARLVTIHLTKIDGGMWPTLISGAAPVPTKSSSASGHGYLLSARSASGTRLSEAISEAIAARATGGSPSQDLTEGLDDDDNRSSPREGSSFGFSFPTTDSTLSLQSDDSHTVLAGRRSSIEEAARDEAKFNMDPVSLTLVGFRLKSAASPRRGAWDEAFEYFVRSWRMAPDLPVATRVLVQDYLPLYHHQQGELEEAAAHYRPRMIAALGGSTALARLYVSMARLSLSSSSTSRHHRSFLFPSGAGQSHNPYATSGSQHQLYLSNISSPARSPSSPPSSPRSGSELSDAEYTLRFGPLAFLEEAFRLDPHVFITSIEWAEARGLAENARMELSTSQDEQDDLLFAPTTVDANTGRQRKQGNAKERQRRRKARLQREQAKEDDGLMAILGGAALVIAGGAVLVGWWKKGFTTGSST